MLRTKRWAGRWACWLLVGVIGCGDDAGPSTPDAGEEDSGARGCVRDDECSDGVFCNGIERCLPRHADANAEGCVAGTPPRCDDGLACTVDTCSHLTNGCRFVPIDADGDGHAAANCMSNEGEALGDDCDDSDANRFPGNPETCTVDTEDHDEDCNPESFGWRDADGDGVVAVACCNGDVCGTDCDDSERRIAPDYPEICDEIDNDCDTRIDEDAISRPWYPDSDGDGFGSEGESEVSCAPVDNHSLFSTDCDDVAAAINPAALENCDGVDNDCDGATDEGDVCLCGVPGAAPCECSAGNVDCLGGLIPRACVGGHWVTEAACAGLKPICAIGRCVCADGGMSCDEVPDSSPPFVVAIAPASGGTAVSTAIVVAVVLSEPPAPASITAQNFRVLDAFNVAISGTRAIDGNLIAFTPSDPLLPGRIYTVVFENVSDRVGNTMRSSQSWRFTTAVADYPRTQIITDPDRSYDSHTLIVGEGGHAAIAARYDRQQGDIIIPNPEVFRLGAAGAWVPTEWLTTSVNPPLVGLASDGTLFGANAGEVSPVYALPLGNVGWGSDQSMIGLQAARALAASGNRYALVTSDLNSMAVRVGQVGTEGTTALPALAPPLPAGSHVFDVAINATGDVALLATLDTSVTLAYWNGAWISRTFVADQATDGSVHLNANGRAVATWLARVPRVTGITPTLISIQHAALFDATAIGNYVEMTGNSWQALPNAVWLSDGAVLLVRASDDVTANRLEANGTLGPLMNVEATVDGNRIGGIDVAALPNGNAIAVWPQGNSAFGSNVVVAARYVGGVWLSVEAIADSLNPQEAQVEALPDGRALLAWKEGGGPGGVSIVLE